ncbi:MAG: hypothetical protein JSS56_02495 [Proteobacteria bacterium]|nr:hypothetical protein [Pseudomonadota bacterium]
MRKSMFAAAVVAALLAACGGEGGELSRSAPGLQIGGGAGGVASGGQQPSGGGDDAAAKLNTAEGFWVGPASTGFTVSLAVLDNGEAWGVYSSGNQIVGALQGSAKGDGTSLSASGTDYNFQSNSQAGASITGTVAQKASIQARTSTGVTLSLKYSAAYDQPASLGNLAGQYAISGRTFDGYFGVNRLTIDASGAFTLLDRGCTATGNVAPRGSKNIFNLNVAFAGATCLVSGSVAGVVYLDTASRQFVALALNGGRTDGMIVVGSKL